MEGLTKGAYKGRLTDGGLGRHMVTFRPLNAFVLLHRLTMVGWLVT